MAGDSRGSESVILLGDMAVGKKTTGATGAVDEHFYLITGRKQREMDADPQLRSLLTLSRTSVHRKVAPFVDESPTSIKPHYLDSPSLTTQSLVC